MEHGTLAVSQSKRDHYSKIIDATVFLLSTGMKQVETFFESDSMETFQKVYSRFMESMTQFSNGTCDSFPYLSTDEMLEMIEQLLVLDSSFAQEVQLNFTLQKEVIGFVDHMSKKSLSVAERKTVTSISKFCYKDDVVLVSALLPLLKDITTAMYSLILFWKSLTSDEDITDIIKKLGDESGTKVERLMLLAQVLCSKENAIIPYCDLEMAGEITARIDEDGNFLPPKRNVAVDRRTD